MLMTKKEFWVLINQGQIDLRANDICYCQGDKYSILTHDLSNVVELEAI